MTANISPDAMRALRPHLETEHVDDETLRQISEETGIPLDELLAAREALWNNSLGRPSIAATRSNEPIDDGDASTEEAKE